MERSRSENLAAFTIGFLGFLVVDFLLVAIGYLAPVPILNQGGSPAVGSGFLAIVLGLVWLAARTRWRWVGIGFAAGFAVMTLVTGGVCTLFGVKTRWW